ncbi:hypothetical protein GALL_237290 [mine drainage metagenome]|uniref:Uncharacterized protein n=1 Tax=mine drainage metagenome TaxID=410659 RepID=A0A1J5RXT9_9ZZZZ
MTRITLVCATALIVWSGPCRAGNTGTAPPTPAASPSTTATVKQDLKEGGHAVGHAARVTTRAIGHGARDAAHAIGHGARDAAHDVGSAADRAWHDLTR